MSRPEAADRLLAGEGLSLTREDFAALLRGRTPQLAAELAAAADSLRRETFGTDVYVRGLIEFSNVCKNNCYYCGIRAGNPGASRYRLGEDEILSCCAEGYDLGYRTFVLQGGEDPAWGAQRMAALVSEIKSRWPACAVTLSVGEHSRETYALWKRAGADRYLLRHETADAAHYRHLHPPELSFENRMRCLWDLKDLSYQVGCGMMVGSPGQRPEHLGEDLCFLGRFQPQMVGIGPFLPAAGTPFAGEPAGSFEETLYLLSIIRLLLPKVLLPATTALGTIHPLGREMGMKAGANVVMPNLSPVAVREKYALYDHKICTGEESAQCKDCLSGRMAAVGYRIVTARGDAPDWAGEEAGA